MKKNEFLEKLRNGLAILEESEIEDILEEYGGYIDEKIRKGMNEEDAVKDFGDINELITELLKAYKVKANYGKQKEDAFHKITNKVMDIIQVFVDYFSHSSAKDIIRFLFEVMIILLFIAICKIPFYVLKDLGWDLFHAFHSGLSQVLCSVWSFIIEMAYILMAVILFVKIFEIRFKESLKENVLSTKSEKEINVKEISKKEPTQNEEKKDNKSIFNFLSFLCICFLKFLAGCLLLGCGCFLIGMAFCLGLSVYLLLQGVTYYGFYLLVFALLLIAIIFSEILFNFIMNRAQKTGRVFVTLLFSVLLLGVSISLCAVEVSETTIYFENQAEENLITEKKEIAMNDAYVILLPTNRFKIDDSLQDKIVVEYRYHNRYVSFEPNIWEGEDHTLNISCYMGYEWNRDILNTFLEDLREKKFYSYEYTPTVTVYANAENMKKLNENRTNYYDKIYDEKDDWESYYDKYEFCEEELNDLGASNLSVYCKRVLFR